MQADELVSSALQLGVVFILAGLFGAVYNLRMRNAPAAIAIAFLLTLGQSLAAGDIAVYRYGPEISTLTGVIRTEDFFGPPNYGENPQTDRRETAYILWLDRPIDVVPNEGVAQDLNSTDTDAFYGVTRVQPSSPVELGLSSMIGKRVIVSGVLFEHFTGHHVTKVLMMVKTAKVRDQ